MKLILCLVIIPFLTSCAFFATPAGIALEAELVKDVEEVVEYELEGPQVQP